MVEPGMVYMGMSSARAIHTARRVAGLTQRELADLLHYSQATVANWERGAREPPVAAFLKILEICKESSENVLSEDIVSDIQLNELVLLWGQLDSKQRMVVLTTARQQVMSAGEVSVQ